MRADQDSSGHISSGIIPDAQLFFREGGRLGSACLKVLGKASNLRCQDGEDKETPGQPDKFLGGDGPGHGIIFFRGRLDVRIGAGGSMIFVVPGIAAHLQGLIDQEKNEADCRPE
jgi:hypothetical protein